MRRVSSCSQELVGWLVTRTEGVSSKSKVSIHLNFGRELIACNNNELLLFLSYNNVQFNVFTLNSLYTLSCVEH